MRRRMSAFGGKSRQDFPHRKMSANDPKPTLAVQRMLASRHVEHIQNGALRRGGAGALGNHLFQQLFHLTKMGDFCPDLIEVIRRNVANLAARCFARPSQPKHFSDVVDGKSQVARSLDERQKSVYVLRCKFGDRRLFAAASATFLSVHSSGWSQCGRRFVWTGRQSLFPFFLFQLAQSRSSAWKLPCRHSA